MNNTSLDKIVQWISRHKASAQNQLKNATKALVESGYDGDAARAQWKAQVAAQCKPLPGEFYPKSRLTSLALKCLILVAAKVMTSTYVTKLLTLRTLVTDLELEIDSNEKTLEHIHKPGQKDDGKAVDLADKLEDDRAKLSKLKSRLQKGTLILLNKNSASYRLLKKAESDANANIRLQMRALLSRIHFRVIERKFESQRLSRAAVRAKLRGKQFHLDMAQDCQLTGCI
jgi:hypothetical protein